DEQYAGYRARLEDLLAECGVEPAKRRGHAIAITALADGLWLELCLSPGCFTAEEARDIARNFLATIIS
ncbi:MAG: TetR family transcriptional regulator C-terminal domain-containing protein, partial [Novosphingobium sp.]